jgi:hypothetical protein
MQPCTAMRNSRGLKNGWLVRRSTSYGSSPQDKERKDKGKSAVPSTRTTIPLFMAERTAL